METLKLEPWKCYVISYPAVYYNSLQYGKFITEDEKKMIVKDITPEMVDETILHGTLDDLLKLNIHTSNLLLHKRDKIVIAENFEVFKFMFDQELSAHDFIDNLVNFCIKKIGFKLKLKYVLSKNKNMSRYTYEKLMETMDFEIIKILVKYCKDLYSDIDEKIMVKALLEDRADIVRLFQTIIV